MPGTTRRRRKSSVTRFVGDIVDDTWGFVDDVLGRARDVQDDVRRSGRNASEGDEDRISNADLRELRKAVLLLSDRLDELAAKAAA